MMRGIRTDQELDPSLLLRDTRTISMRVKDFLQDPTGVAIILFSSSGVAYIYPAFSIFLLFFMVLLFAYTFRKKSVLPFRLPQTAHTKDNNDLIPGVGKPRTSRGIHFFGNDKETGEEHNSPMV